MKVVIFYGTDCDQKTAWIPWLKKELMSNSIECIIPILPTPENQTYQNWERITKTIPINEKDIVIGWSTGAIFAVRYLYENHIKTNKLILISGFNNYIGSNPFIDNINTNFFLKDISVVKNIANNIVCIKSDNDPFVSQKALDDFAKDLRARKINIPGGGHFNTSAGYNEFPELLNEIIRP